MPLRRIKTSDTSATPARGASGWRRAFSPLGIGVLLAACWLLFKLASWEFQTSTLQSRHFAETARSMRYWMAPGPSDAIRFPDSGPYDERLGYTRIPEFVDRLAGRNFRVVAQARQSGELVRLIEDGFNPPYREKSRAGLRILDCGGEPLYGFSAPARSYADFGDIPPVVVNTLLFIENRELLDAEHPRRNPAVEWDRLAKAAAAQAVRLVDPDYEAPGGSTLATQIEKYRHSPEGRTGSAREKFRQMYSASVRAYRDGEDTMAFRRQVILDYLNTVPLLASPGIGEVNGLGDGLWSWYGARFERVNRLLRELGDGATASDEQGLAFRQVLGLMIAQRRPSYYLGAGQARLVGLTDVYLRLLEKSGVISAGLRDAALRQRAGLNPHSAAGGSGEGAVRKGASALRARLAGLLGISRLYELDRLDLTVASTLDGGLQNAIEERLRQLQDPAEALSAGLVGHHLLERGDPSRVLYSFTLYERAGDRNVLRVQTDNTGQPFDLNEGAKLELGSTAKLRTLASYLEIVAALHERYAAMEEAELRRADAAHLDRLSRWAIQHLSGGSDRSLEGMLAAAMQRRYSASPAEAFFTGGGLHSFENFKREDDERNPTVLEALRESINLAFVRIMRDVVQYHTLRLEPEVGPDVLRDPDHPQRVELLERFAEREGRQFVRHFHAKYRGLAPAEVADLLVRGTRPTVERLAVIFRSLDPAAGEEALRGFIERYLPQAQLSAQALRRLHERHAQGRYTLQDRGYLARVHPLELWVASRVYADPQVEAAVLIESGGTEIRESYAWLFRPRLKAAQDKRIQMMLESRAFAEIHRGWKRMGYPFDYLVPSLATAIGSSGDRPSALAELMGIIVNDGLRLPVARISGLHLASATPYETVLDYHAGEGERVMAPEVATTLRHALIDVVDHGTARRVSGAFDAAEGARVPVGGKTGTGDNRHETYGHGGTVLDSRVLNRTATFAFFIGDRHFGVVTAYAPGPQAGEYRFTSALPTQILKVLAPLIRPAIEVREGEHCPSGEAGERNPGTLTVASGRTEPAPSGR